MPLELGIVKPRKSNKRLIIKITLFQEGNIFGTNAGLANIWSSNIKIYMHLIITKQWKLFAACTELVRSPYIKHAASGLSNPTRLEGEVRFIQAQDQQVLPHVIREWWQSVYSLDRCKLKCIYHFMVCACICTCIYNQPVSCRCSLSLFSLSNCINVFVWHNNSIRKHEYKFITTITIQFGESFQSVVAVPLWLLMHTSIFHLFWCPRLTQHLQLETSFRPEDHTDWEMAPPTYNLQSWGSLGSNEQFRIFYPH